jgi:hypothetical protein
MLGHNGSTFKQHAGAADVTMVQQCSGVNLYCEGRWEFQLAAAAAAAAAASNSSNSNTSSSNSRSSSE